jgi:type I restriction enzyme R subunit
MRQVLAARAWAPPQRRWLERIGKQMEQETIVDREALDQGQFRAEGGYARLNKVFDGRLDAVLREITDAVWSAAA